MKGRFAFIPFYPSKENPIARPAKGTRREITERKTGFLKVARETNAVRNPAI
jgi:hypothetical protein